MTRVGGDETGGSFKTTIPQPLPELIDLEHKDDITWKWNPEEEDKIIIKKSNTSDE